MLDFNVIIKAATTFAFYATSIAISHFTPNYGFMFWFALSAGL